MSRNGYNYLGGIFLPNLVSVSENCPFVERISFETGTGCPICFTETVKTIEPPRCAVPTVLFVRI